MLAMFRLIITLVSLLLAKCFDEEKMEKCAVRNTCRYSTEADMPICYCDEHCLKFNDCCQEYILTNNDTVAQGNADFYSCVDVMPESYTSDVRVGSFMIDRCKESGLLCNITPGSLESIVPVSNERKTFRNSNCAKCNGVFNFTYWTILVKISKGIEIKKLDIQPLLTGKSFLKVANDILPIVKYNLFPPDYLRPRYCSSEIFRKETTIQKERQYQNFALCKNYLVKNPDQCLNNGFSMSDEIKCVFYDTTYLTTRNLTFQKSTSMSLQVLVELGSKSSDPETSEKDDIGVTSLTFMHKRLNIYTEINLEKSAKINGSTQLVEECISSLIVLLQSSRYVLFNEFSQFGINTNDGFKYSSRMIVRAMTKLGLSEMESLRTLFLNFQFKEFNEKTFAAGYVQADPSNSIDSKPYTAQDVKIIDFSRISLLSHDDMDIISCGNLSFSLQRRIPTTAVYGVRCTDNPNEKNSRNHGNVCSLSVSLAVILVIYALWLSRKGDDVLFV